SLQSKDVDAWISLGVKVGSAIIYDPLTGAYGKARVKQEDGVSKVLLDIKSGQSFILRIFANEQLQAPDWTYTFPASAGLLINTNWKLNFTQSTP
ncbi:MAG: glycosyl hydrolase family 2, partial [Bacteroides sp.]